jgi:hypothetical protein
MQISCSGNEDFVTVCVIVWRDDGCGMVVKGNNSGRWSSDDVVLWLGRRQNGDVIDW